MNEKNATTTYGNYTHKLKEPFVWEEKTYEQFEFDYGSLRGKDLAEIELELSNEGQYAISPEFSSAYLLKIAARAAGVHASVIENLPLSEAIKIRSRTKNFMTRGV